MSRKHRGNDLLSSSFATRGGYNEEATTSLSLTLCTTISIKQQQPSNIMKVCALSHIYTHMTFRHIYICVLPNRSGPIGTGSGIDRFSVSSIRRDMFPNNKYIGYESDMVIIDNSYMAKRITEAKHWSHILDTY